MSIVAVGPQRQSSFPVIVYNGSEGPISRVEVSGRVTDADGATITTGQSQGFAPPVVPSGGHTFGYVFASAEQLPDDATLDDPVVDFTEGLGDFENIVAVDVNELEVLDERAVGQISNPHDVLVTGPISVYVTCFSSSGELSAVLSTFADRDELQPGGSSTFVADFFGDLDCPAAIGAASGFVDNF